MSVQQQQQEEELTVPPSPHGPERCALLGGSFANSVQMVLAAAAIGTLVYKRQTELPKRPWLVWAFDASKQAYAGLLQHLVNLGFGMWFAASGVASECAWYLVNFAISVVCGVFLLWGAMKLYTRIVDRFRLNFLRSGEYGNPPSWRPWLAQLIVWGFLASGEKAVTAVLVIVPLHTTLDGLAVMLERPFVPYPRLELILVMVIAPVLLNAFFFWLIDSMIMRKRAVRQLTGDGEDDRKPLLDDSCSCCPSRSV